MGAQPQLFIIVKSLQLIWANLLDTLPCLLASLKGRAAINYVAKLVND